MKLSSIPIADKAAGMVYSSTDVRNIYGLAQRTLAYWYDQGLCIPEITDVRGRGNRRKYSFTDVILAGVIQFYVQTGIKHAHIRDIIERVRGRMKDVCGSYHPMFLSVVLQEESVPRGEEPSWAVDVIPIDTMSDIFGAGAVALRDETTGEPVSPGSLPKSIIILNLAPIVSEIFRYVS